MSKVLVVGASGATGKHLVTQLLKNGVQVRAIVRSIDSLPEGFRSQSNLQLIQGSILDMDALELAEHTSGCDAVASCLGHNLSFKGLFGAPYRLVTESVRNLCKAIESNGSPTPVKFILMNTTGNRHRGLNEKISISQHVVITLLRLLLPPHADNEAAAEYLRSTIGSDNPAIDWCVVRPDSLINDSEISEFSVHPSPTRSAIFDAGKTSRINVGSFMTSLIIDSTLWSEWKARMPVIYNVTNEA